MNYLLRSRAVAPVVAALVLVLVASLDGCSDTHSEVPADVSPPIGKKGEVVLPADSPKRDYVKVAKATLSSRPLIEPLAGRLTYDETHTARVTTPIGGRIVSELPELGARETKGDALLEIDSPDLATAESENAKAAADLAQAEKAYSRAEALYEGRALALKDLEQATNDLAHARSEIQRTAQHLVNLQVRGAQAYGRFVLRTPIAGVVTERNINPGLEVRPDLAAPLVVVSDLSRLWVVADVFEKDLGVIKRGQTVRISVPAYPEQTFAATIDNIARVVDDTSRTVKVRATVENPNGVLMPAMYASVIVDSDPDDRAIIVPLTALLTEGEHDWAYIQVGDGKYERRALVIGLRLKDRAVIKDGIADGEMMVTDGALLLRSEERDD